MKINLLTLFLMSVALMACSPAGTPVHPSVPPATSAPIVAVQSQAYPTAVIPKTAIPTFTLPPAQPTLSVQEIAGAILTELSIDESHSSSPNGMCEWKRIMAWPVKESSSNKYAGQYFTYVTIACANQEPLVLVKGWNDMGLGYPLSSLLGWSEDGKYAYIYDEIIPDGCPPPGGFEQNLRRVDLATGEIHLYPIDLTGGMVLSPDGTKVMYYDKRNDMLGVYDLASGDEQRLPFDIPGGSDWYASSFTWSPDGERAVFIVQYGDACIPNAYSVRLVDLKDNSVQTVVAEEKQPVSIISWAEPDQVLLSIGGENKRLDPFSGSLTP